MSWSTVAADIVWDPSTWAPVPGVTETELSSTVQSRVLNALQAIYNTGGIGQTMLDSLAGAGPTVALISWQPVCLGVSASQGPGFARLRRGAPRARP